MTKFFHFQPHDMLPLRSGPLGPHLVSFATLLARQGYQWSRGWQKVHLVADLNQWLTERHIGLDQLDEHQTSGFLESRGRTRRRVWSEPSTMAFLLFHLRQAGVIAGVQIQEAKGAQDRLLQDYGQFLERERGLLPETIGTYLPVIRSFLKFRFPSGNVQMRGLRAGDSADFILQLTDRGHRSLPSTASALRSFLRYLLQRGRITAPLANAVPSVTARRGAELPKFLETDQVEKLLKSCDRRRRVGRRDFAMLLLMVRLGLRAGEVARLHLEEIDWEAGEVDICGKGAQRDRLPLPHDVGQAIAAYLKTRYSGGISRCVFLRSQAPYEGLTGAGAVGGVVRRALARAHLHPPRRGAHLLRHSLATRMLRGGASMAQIGQVLRHQQAQTTEIYAKVDLKALRTLAQPWPGGGQ